MARSSIQNEKMRDERKEIIRKEALRLFARKGLFATKIKDIAVSAGMAQGLIYHYYSSKEEIYVELILSALEKLNAAVLQLRKMPQSPHIKIRMAIEEMLRTIESSEDFNQTCRLIAQATNSDEVPEEARQAIAARRDIPYDEIAHILAQGQQEGTVIEGDPHELALIFWTTINGLAIYQATRPTRASMPNPRLIARLFIKDPILNTD